jgi:hypothetical protein
LPYPPQLPQNEEIQVQLSNNLGAATEQENVVCDVATDDWTMNLDRGDSLYPGVFTARATATITPVLNAWSGAQPITLSQSLRGGVYGVCGMICQGTNAVAARIVFPRNKLYHGRRLRPGALVQTAIGDVAPLQLTPWVVGLGMLGYFNTFELPQVKYSVQ